ncbi:MAG: translation initiation factor eIF-2B [archaeon]
MKPNQVEKTAIAIRDLQIQGAINVARSALSALRFYIVSEKPGKAGIEKSAALLAAQRPTEPALQNLLSAVLRSGNPEKKCDKLLSEIGVDSDRIVRSGLPLVKPGSTIITHCHASSVTSLLREARARGTRFSVLHTETRPRYQGHRTARDLVSGGIRQTMFVDSAMNYFMPEADIALVGADALLPDGFVNKIGTSLLALSAREHGKPLYAVLGLIKFAETGKIHIEKRPVSELGFHLHGARLENPAFDFIPKKFVRGIVCEEGILAFGEAVKAARKKVAGL